MLTQKRLKQLLKYDPLSGYFTWLISPNRRIKVGSVAGTKSNGYILIQVEGKRYRANRLAWLYVYGYFPEYEIDHKNRIRSHNRIDNLRAVTNQCNQRNRGNPKNNKSGVKGVTWDKRTGKWMAGIKINGKNIYIGRYKEFLEAACHRLAAEQFEGWQGCDSSSPAFKYVSNYLKFKGVL